MFLSLTVGLIGSDHLKAFSHIMQSSLTFNDNGLLDFVSFRFAFYSIG